MSGERMTSKSYQELMKRLFDETIRELQRYGFDRAQIGAALVGIGTGLFAADRGIDKTIKLICAHLNTLEDGEAINALRYFSDDPGRNNRAFDLWMVFRCAPDDEQLRRMPNGVSVFGPAQIRNLTC